MSATTSEETRRKDPRETSEPDLDALFRELDSEPAAALVGRKRRARRMAGPALMATGLILIAGGFLAALIVRDPGMFLTVVLTMNVAAVLCVAGGVLLLPENPKRGGWAKP